MASKQKPIVTRVPHLCCPFSICFGRRRRFGGGGSRYEGIREHDAGKSLMNRAIRAMRVARTSTRVVIPHR